MSHFIEDDPNFYKRNSIFEEDHLDEEDDDEISFWCEETEEEYNERIQAYAEHKRKSEEEAEEYREYCETMNRLEAVYYGREDYM